MKPSFQIFNIERENWLVMYLLLKSEVCDLSLRVVTRGRLHQFPAGDSRRRNRYRCGACDTDSLPLVANPPNLGRQLIVSRLIAAPTRHGGHHTRSARSLDSPSRTPKPCLTSAPVHALVGSIVVLRGGRCPPAFSLTQSRGLGLQHVRGGDWGSCLVV
jgi:hypothetical protein